VTTKVGDVIWVEAAPGTETLYRVVSIDDDGTCLGERVEPIRFRRAKHERTRILEQGEREADVPDAANDSAYKRGAAAARAAFGNFAGRLRRLARPRRQRSDLTS
jgi:hypothetical protein